MKLCQSVTNIADPYVATAPAWCGGLNYIVAPDPSSTAWFSFTEANGSGKQEIVVGTVYDPTIYLTGSHVITIRPDYQLDPDESGTYHDGDNISVTFVSMCADNNIEQDSGFLTVYDAYVFETETWTVPTISSQSDT